MKIIDLLNKIANGEEVPEKIKFGDDIYYRKTDANDGYVIDYLDIRDNSLFNFITDYEYCFIKSCLEWEIKDLDKENKIPDELGYQDNADGTFYLNRKKYNSEPIKILSKKINEIISYLDYLKSKGNK